MTRSDMSSQPRHIRRSAAEAPTTRRHALIGLGALGLSGLAACAGTKPGRGARASVPLPEPQIDPAAVVTARGAFEGRSNHVTRGHARVLRSNGEFVIELEPDFFFDGAPDPRVGLGHRGYDPSSLLQPLRSNSGRQAFALRPGLDIGDYTQVWIWCERFSVPLGVAELTLL
ncbi:MAG: DM13 domain-containing protein [Pikeienuella sp.]